MQDEEKKGKNRKKNSQKFPSQLILTGILMRTLEKAAFVRELYSTLA